MTLSAKSTPQCRLIGLHDIVPDPAGLLGGMYPGP